MPESPPPRPPHAGTPGAGASVEQQLRLAEQRLTFHVENTPLVVIEWDHEMRVARWNAQAERVFGWKAEEVIGKGPLDWPFVIEENRELAQRMMNDAIAGREPRSVVTVANYTKSGGIVWCEWYSSICYDEAGKMLSALSLGLDITERRETAEALSLSREQMRTALGGAKMLAWDLDLTTNRWQTTIDIPGFYGVEHGPDYSNPELALLAVHPDDVAVVQAGRQRAVETGEPMRYEFRGRVPMPDGQPRWFATRGRALRDATGRPVRIVAVTTDITERKRADAERAALNQQLQDAQRWESLGVLAGGVAHDFNNILTVVLGSAGLARRGLPPGSPTVGYLEHIEQACRRAADVCRQMLAYAGRAHNTGGRTDLAALVRESVPLLEIPAGKAAVKLELAPHLPEIQVDSAQVRQVLMNLVTNAAEAIGGEPGDIVVGARVVEVPPGASDSGFQLAPPPGRYVLLTVSDTGGGMSAEARARMFDPFYTTKFAGRGLGLSAALGIARANKGGIHVATAPGRGTVVSVYWPAAPDPEPAPENKVSPADAVLVIDDEMFVREVTASTLEEMGFAPLLAADGPSGIAVFRGHRDAIKLAVIDVMMPGMAGDQVAAALRELDPALPIILVSGFADRRVIKSTPGARTEFLQKPFHPEELMAVVRRLV
jgi:PAS domain S-box-containing protein